MHDQRHQFCPVPFDRALEGSGNEAASGDGHDALGHAAATTGWWIHQKHVVTALAGLAEAGKCTLPRTYALSSEAKDN
jgi:hypothetical protein